MFENLLAKSEQCHKEVALEYFNAFTGQKDELKVVGIMQKYPELYSQETLDQVSKAAKESGSADRSARFMLEILKCYTHFSTYLPPILQKRFWFGFYGVQ